MRRLAYAIALTIAFGSTFALTSNRNDELAAQGVLCNCAHQTTSGGFVPCLGTGNLNTVSCTQVGTQCFIGGIGSWAPDTPTNCVYNGASTGWVKAIALGSGGPSYFNASVTSTPPWGVISQNCGTGHYFGAQMEVLHDTWTGNCNCQANTPTVTPVAVTLYTCGP